MEQSSAEWSFTNREMLRQCVSDPLASDAQVDYVEPQGSLAAGTGDLYADIDLFAHLQPDVADRQFFFRLPGLMDTIGRRIIDGVSFAALPAYVGTFYFEGFPLFWHVDIGCIPADPQWHVDSNDLATSKRWEQRFKMWIKAVKLLLRAEDGRARHETRAAFNAYMSDLKLHIAKRMDVSSVGEDPHGVLSTLLEMEIAWHRAQGIRNEALFAACDSLRRSTLD